MSRDIKKRIINGKEYAVKMIDPRRGLKIAFSLIKTFKEPLFIYYRDKVDNLLDEEAKKLNTIDLIVRFIEENLDMLDDIANIILEIDIDEVIGHLETLLEEASVDGKPIENFDDLFAGNYFEMFQVLRFALEVNFLGFFVERFAQIKEEAQKVKMEANQTNESQSLQN